MALADTARLIAALELQDKFSQTAAKYDRTIGGMERKTSTLGKISGEVGRGAQTAITNVAKVGVFAASAIATQVGLGVQSLAELEEVKNQTDAVIKSTEGAANVSAQHIRERAEELENLSTVDDKVIQRGQNMLLTFTSIRNEVGKGNDIFDQATDTALDMSVALGTDIKDSAIQLGKALNDPIRGVTALRRVGVQFTDQQLDQIKAMVEANDTMGAQKLILEELNREFGGSAEAFGEGPGADMRRFGDAVEGAQQALATGFLPLITKASDKVQEVLGNPEVQARIRGFGEGAAEGIDDLIDIATRLPWNAIGTTFSLMGQGAKAALDLFTSMPPWIQTAVLTGWGVNKLTGGALGNIVGELGKGLVKGVLGMNAGVVNINAATVNGPGGVPAGAGRAAGAGGAALLGTAGIATLALTAGTVIGEQVYKAVNPIAHDFRSLVSGTEGRPASMQLVEGQLQALSEATGRPVKDLQAAMIPLLQSGDMTWSEIVAAVRNGTSVLDQKLIDVANRATTQIDVARQAKDAASFDAARLSGNITSLDANDAARASAQLQKQSEALAAVRATHGPLNTIATKDFSPTINVHQPPLYNNISITNFQHVGATYRTNTVATLE